MTSHAIVALTALLFLFAPAGALAQSGLQFSPDGKRTLVNKDLGGERWAITLNEDDGTITGNVFSPNGGPPTFVWCSESARTETDITFSCSGASPCPLSPCPAEDEWTFIAEASLPFSFFQPRAETEAPASARSIGLGRPQQDGGASPASGVQPSRDAKRTLISKDVGAERWAIVWNRDDRTITGNVFFPGGGDPQFVWCAARGGNEVEIQFSCHAAQRCGAPPCRDDTWAKLADVILPVSFLEPPEQLSGGELAQAIVAAFGPDEGFEAVLLALDRGYSMRQIARGALSGRLQDSGEITRKAGGPETPALPPTDLLTGDIDGLESVAADSELVRLICDQFGDDVSPDQKVEILTRLINRGYTVEQIIRVGRGEASVSSCDGAPTPAAFSDCVQTNGGDSLVLIDEGGPVTPGRGEEVVLEPEPVAECNRDGRRQPGEQCDGSDLNGLSCISPTSGFFPDNVVGGELRCDEFCNFDATGCRTEAVCGDGHLDLGEDCDGTNLGGAACDTVHLYIPGAGPETGRFTGGTLGCTNNPDGPCVYETSGCLTEPICGNGRIEVGEDCDLGQLGGATCVTVHRFLPPGTGNELPEFVGGQLGCIVEEGARCRFDISGCREADESVCGDGERDPREICDGDDLAGRTCRSEGFVGGELRCVNDEGVCVLDDDGCRTPADVRCGDGFIDEGEVCDRNGVGGETCESQGYASGELGCIITSDPTRPCVFDFERCNSRPECNNGIAEGDPQFDEECDGRDFRGQTCESLGLLGDPDGVLECDPRTCRIDRDRSCRQSQTCLNGVAEGTEQCDRDDLRGGSCEGEGFDFGDLACGSDCVYDTSGCGRGCGLGEDTCPDGACVPAGADCCGNRAFCQPGTVCTGDGGCCPEALPEPCGSNSCIQAGADCCGASGNWCQPGSVCAGDGCCPIEFPQPCGGRCIRAEATCCNGQAIGPADKCCGGRTPCGAGNTCCGTSCVPPGRACCGGNLACETPGWVCTNIVGVCCPPDAPQPCAADMTCRPAGSSCP